MKYKLKINSGTYMYNFFFLKLNAIDILPPPQLKCTANGISVQNVNVLPNIYGHIFENSPYI